MIKSKQVVGFDLAAKWQKKPYGLTPEEGWFILTNLGSLELAIKSYKKAHRLRRGNLGVKTEQERFGIEEMFRDFKKRCDPAEVPSARERAPRQGGYNLEGTKVTDARLIA